MEDSKSQKKEHILITLPQPEPTAVIERLKKNVPSIESIKYINTKEQDVPDGKFFQHWLGVIFALLLRFHD